MESGRKSVVELLYRNSQHVKAVGCFHGGVPSMILDRIPNATLYEGKVSTPGLHKGILNFPCLLVPLIFTKHKTIS